MTSRIADTVMQTVGSGLVFVCGLLALFATYLEAGNEAFVLFVLLMVVGIVLTWYGTRPRPITSPDGPPTSRGH